MSTLRVFPIALTLLLAHAISAGPVVSPARDIGDFPLMQAVWSQTIPRAVTNGEDYLVVYMHGSQEGRLRAARITSDGDVLDPFCIEIGNTNGSGLTSAFDVVWTGSQYLIAWNRPECAGFESCLQLSAVKADGEVEHLAQLPEAEGAQFALRGDSLLIAWREFDSLQARLLPLGGEPGEPVTLLEVDRFVSIERVVATSSGYLVFAHANARDEKPEQLLLIPVDSSGKPGDVSVLAEKGNHFNLGFGSIATTGDATVVLFGGGWRSENLAILGPDGEELVRRDPFTAWVPEDTLLLPDGADAFLMVSRPSSVVIQTLSTAGEPGPVWTLQPGIEDGVRLSAVAGAPSSLLLLWEEQKGDGWSEPGGMNQFVRTYDRALQPFGPEVPLMVSAPVQRLSAVAASNDRYLHVWEEYRDGIWQIYSQPAGVDGDPTAWPTDHAHGQFSVTSDGESFVLAIGRFAWTGERFRRFVELKRIGTDGSVLDRAEIEGALGPKIVFDGENFVLLWRERIEDRYPDVPMLTVLDASLAPVTAVTLDGFLDAAGFDGGVYILELIEGERAYPDYPPTRGLGVRVVTTDESVTIGPQTVIVEPSLSPVRDVRSETIATKGSEALVYWQQYESDGGAVWGYREATALLNSSGNITAEARGDLDKTSDTAAGAMTWSGTRFVSANMSELGDRLLLRYFDRRGSFMDRIEVPANSYANAVPSIASIGGGHVVVDYSAFVSNHLVGVGVERVFTRTIEMKSERRRTVSRASANAPRSGARP